MLQAKQLKNRLRALRLQKDWTQSELAEKLFVTPQTISKWEQGTALPDIPNLCRLAETLGVSVDELLTPAAVCPLYIGIDGGGSKTEYVLFDREGTVRRRLVKEGTNPNDCGAKASAERLLAGISELMTGITGVVGIAAGIAGCASAHHRTYLSERLSERYPSVTITVTSDIENVILRTFDRPDNPCIAAICGTGTVVFANTADGRHRLGGWGYLLDGAGSGYDIGRDALTAVLSAKEELGPSTALTAAVERQLGGEVSDKLYMVYEGGRRFIASFAKTVLALGEQGDAVAAAIVLNNMQRLAQRIALAADRYACGDTVLLAGGVLQNEESAARWLSPYLPPSLRLVLPTLPPVYGACKAALGGVYPDGFAERFEQTYFREVMV